MNFPNWTTVQTISDLWDSGQISTAVNLANVSMAQFTDTLPDLADFSNDQLAILYVLGLQSGEPGARECLLESPDFETYLGSGLPPALWLDQITGARQMFQHLASLPKLSYLEGTSLMQKFWLGQTEISDGIFALLHTAPSTVSWWANENEFNVDALLNLLVSTFHFEPDFSSAKREESVSVTCQILNSYVSWVHAQEFGMAYQQFLQS